jgi:hypothetical protein
MWHPVGLDRTDILEEHVASIFRVERFSKLGTALAVYGISGLRGGVLNNLGARADDCM